jgi:hypothetical protein
MGMKLRWLALLFLSSAAALAVAQSATSPAAKESTTIHVTSRLVYVDVIVRDQEGHAVQGLTQRDFKLEQDGKEQPA